MAWRHAGYSASRTTMSAPDGIPVRVHPSHVEQSYCSETECRDPVTRSCSVCSNDKPCKKSPLNNKWSAYKREQILNLDYLRPVMEDPDGKGAAAAEVEVS